jgi:membrane protease YdiL (CAAX protease family)
MKGKSLIEVSLVFLATQIISWILKPIQFFKDEIAILGWSYTSGVISMVITFLAIYLSTSNFKENGFKKEGWKFALDIGFTGWLVWVIPIAALLLLQLTYTNLLDSFIISGFIFVAILLLLLITKNTDREKVETNKRKAFVNMAFLTLLLLMPIFFSLYLHKSPNTLLKVVSTVIWQFIFSGFGEEFRYRGYYQPRVNKEYGTPYKLLNVNFGIGLFVAAALFGLSHIFNPFSPFEGVFELNWGWGIWTFAAGLFFGLIKEKTQNIIAPGIAHGSDAFGAALLIIFG